MHRLYSIAIPVFMLVVSVELAVPTIPTLGLPAPVASGIVATDDGTVYFIDSFSNTVWRSRPGEATTAFVTGRTGRSLQIDSDGNIYGTHRESRGTIVLWRADPNGTVTELSRTSIPENHGHTLLIGDTGDIFGWTGNGRRSGVRLWRARAHEQHFVAGGEWGFRDGPGADARFFAIGGMAHTHDGDLIVTSGATVRRICREGQVTTIAADLPLLRPRPSLLARIFGESQSHLTGVAVAGNGDIYVANAARDVVIRIDRNGRTTEIHSSEPGWKPTGVATANGVVYILEYGNGVRVQRVMEMGG
ncbi:hypothetical protein BH23GEM9_BH23GEM9_20620 [soil metagenome]